jgi:uncharacterized protein (DUF342 family)
MSEDQLHSTRFTPENNSYSIRISEDKMTAELIYSAQFWKEPISSTEIKLFLQQQGIMSGFNETLIAEIASDPSQYAGIPLIIAEGVPAIPGEDAKIELVCLAKGKSETSSHSDVVDYRNVNNVINVKAGELLARKHPPTAGRAGQKVTGEVIPAKQGRSIPIKIGKNVVLDASGEFAYAVIDGQVAITDRDRINVFPVYEVNGDVDYSVGNIHFVGTVIIKGNVLSGFTVRAAGDIRIYGEVEAAIIEADGSIEVRAGIAAQGRGQVKAGNNVLAGYINQGNIHAKNDIVVAQSIMHSSITAGRKVICSQGKGVIVGGTIQAGEGIFANVIGNLMHTPTIVEVGVMPELANEYRQIKVDLDLILHELEKTEKGLRLLDQWATQNGHLPPDKQEMRVKFFKHKLSLTNRMSELEHRKAEIEEEMEVSKNAMISVNQIAFPGTKIVFGKYIRFLKQEYQRISFRLIDGEISSVPN